MSCSAKPTTTAPTAEVVSSVSRMITVAIAMNRAITATSCTMPGKRSFGRSSRHLLASDRDRRNDDREHQHQPRDGRQQLGVAEPLAHG